MNAPLQNSTEKGNGTLQKLMKRWQSQGQHWFFNGFLFPRMMPLTCLSHCFSQCHYCSVSSSLPWFHQSIVSQDDCVYKTFCERNFLLGALTDNQTIFLMKYWFPWASFPCQTWEVHALKTLTITRETTQTTQSSPYIMFPLILVDFFSLPCSWCTF